MPRTVDEGFKDFLTKLTPSAIESEAVKKHRASIKACLEASYKMNRFVRIGSFGNGTSIAGYSDVDYLASLPTSQLNQNSTYTLSKVKTTLDTRFPRTGVQVSCPAVAIPFGTKAAEHTEIVPADFVNEDEYYKIYEIADCSGGWMRVCPDAHNAYSNYANSERGGKAKPLIRFIKAWKYYCNVPISSFYLEMQTAKYALGEDVIVYAIDVKRVLKMLLDSELAMMQDPMGRSGYIVPCKTEAMKQDALSKLQIAVSRAEKALAADSATKTSDAFYWWRLLYNDQFPTYYY
ncbi:nucleotidyltransferase [Mariprofundus sp. KV]|uniref:SMODS domain-containing nucleotidyltransferase n=1 Tax=Mariprofundus sp. KV TaxID=2608715 RepID=UPI0015A42CB3|nr:nucleotidyltransferase [Mariprofundus sp. KV]NWF36662.1 nucleotidyltransferase [Mariprofundus sp. KV]